MWRPNALEKQLCAMEGWRLVIWGWLCIRRNCLEVFRLALSSSFGPSSTGSVSVDDWWLRPRRPLGHRLNSHLDSSAHSEENAEERMSRPTSVWCRTFQSGGCSFGRSCVDIGSIPSGHTSYALKPILFTVSSNRPSGCLVASDAWGGSEALHHR